MKSQERQKRRERMKIFAKEIEREKEIFNCQLTDENIGEDGCQPIDVPTSLSLSYFICFPSSYVLINFEFPICFPDPNFLSSLSRLIDNRKNMINHPHPKRKHFD